MWFVMWLTGGGCDSMTSLLRHINTTPQIQLDTSWPSESDLRVIWAYRNKRRGRRERERMMEENRARGIEEEKRKRRKRERETMSCNHFKSLAYYSGIQLVYQIINRLHPPTTPTHNQSHKTPNWLDINLWIFQFQYLILNTSNLKQKKIIIIIF